MHLANAAALFALMAASTGAFVIPDGATDGVYAVARDAKGNDVHTKLSARTLDSKFDLKTRSDGQIWCGMYLHARSSP
jgi:hypothetical protein